MLKTRAISILIPVFRDYASWQARRLAEQCRRLEGVRWEIVIADDGSGEPWASAVDDAAAVLGCRVLKRQENTGRAAIRNYLAREARYDTIIYIDSGLMPGDHFVERYANMAAGHDVVCGTISVNPEMLAQDPSLKRNLRCRLEMRAERRFTAQRHAADPWRNFHSGTFMARRQVMLDNPFDENIKTYGYEDTLFGKRLKDRGVKVEHIDNPVAFTSFESNSRYLEKTREAMHTLYAYRGELRGYSPLLSLAERLLRLRLLPLLRPLTGEGGTSAFPLSPYALLLRHPSPTLFTLYRLSLLARLYGG